MGKHSVTAIVSCDYEEFTSNYNAFTVTAGLLSKRFESGDPVNDFSEARGYAEATGLVVMYSSSIDLFLFDNKEYAWIDGRIQRFSRQPLT